MTRFFRLGFPLLLLAGCTAPMDEEWSPYPDDYYVPENRYQVVVESVTFTPTKPGGAPWDAVDGKPDPCVLVGDEWAWYDMTPIAYDEYSTEWSFVTLSDFSLEELGEIGLTINDEDPPDENDTEPTPVPEPSPAPTPPDNYLFCDRIEGSEIGVEGQTLQVGTTVVTFHDWVLKAGEDAEYHGVSWDQTGTVDVYVKAGTQTFIASGGSWLHPDAGTNAPAISNIEVCQDIDDQLDFSVVSLVPDDLENGETFVFEPGLATGVEELVVRVQKSDASDW